MIVLMINTIQIKVSFLCTDRIEKCKTMSEINNYKNYLFDCSFR